VLTESLRGGVNVYEYPPDTIQSPAVIVAGIDWQWDVMGDTRVVTLPLYLAVSRRNTNYLAELDRMTDPLGPVVAAFDADPEDADVASWNVTSVGQYRDISIADTDYYAATVTLEVFC
jgi:hypothetical protein